MTLAMPGFRLTGQTITRQVSIQIVPVATTTVAGGGGELQGADNHALGLGIDQKLLMGVLVVPLFGLLTGFMGIFV
jgi:hypothetical protein